MENKYWKNFYKKKEITSKPSSFAKWIKELKTSKKIYDIGCGNGRDSKYFIKKGFDVVSVDLNSDYGIKKSVIKFVNSKLEEGTFYSRFFLHSISNEDILNFIEKIPSGSYFVAEYRVKGDEPVIYKEHKRNFINQEWLLLNLIMNNYRIEYSIVSRGLAKYKKEDPLIGRVIAHKYGE